MMASLRRFSSGINVIETIVNFNKVPNPTPQQIQTIVEQVSNIKNIGSLFTPREAELASRFANTIVDSIQKVPLNNLVPILKLSCRLIKRDSVIEGQNKKLIIRKIKRHIDSFPDSKNEILSNHLKPAIKYFPQEVNIHLITIGLIDAFTLKQLSAIKKCVYNPAFETILTSDSIYLQFMEWLNDNVGKDLNMDDFCLRLICKGVTRGETRYYKHDVEILKYPDVSSLSMQTQILLRNNKYTVNNRADTILLSESDPNKTKTLSAKSLLNNDLVKKKEICKPTSHSSNHLTNLFKANRLSEDFSDRVATYGIVSILYNLRNEASRALELSCVNSMILSDLDKNVAYLSLFFKYYYQHSSVNLQQHALECFANLYVSDIGIHHSLKLLNSLPLHLDKSADNKISDFATYIANACPDKIHIIVRMVSALIRLKQYDLASLHSSKLTSEFSNVSDADNMDDILKVAGFIHYHHNVDVSSELIKSISKLPGKYNHLFKLPYTYIRKHIDDVLTSSNLPIAYDNNLCPKVLKDLKTKVKLDSDAVYNTNLIDRAASINLCQNSKALTIKEMLTLKYYNPISARPWLHKFEQNILSSSLEDVTMLFQLFHEFPNELHDHASIILNCRGYNEHISKFILNPDISYYALNNVQLRKWFSYTFLSMLCLNDARLLTTMFDNHPLYNCFPGKTKKSEAACVETINKSGYLQSFYNERFIETVKYCGVKLRGPISIGGIDFPYSIDGKVALLISSNMMNLDMTNLTGNARSILRFYKYHANSNLEIIDFPNILNSKQNWNQRAVE